VKANILQELTKVNIQDVFKFQYKNSSTRMCNVSAAKLVYTSGVSIWS